MKYPVIEGEQTARPKTERPPRGLELDVARQHVYRDSPFGFVLGDAHVCLERHQDDSKVVVLDQCPGILTGAPRRLGVQSMVPHVLAALGRTHDPANVRHAVMLARDAGFESFNLDLIYGAAGETLEDWRRTVSEALALEPPHISAYGLTVEPGTPLADDPARHPDDDRQAAQYELADELLASAGLANYEISNWARPGHECRHNLLYWTQGDYLGFGCAAHSHEAGRRWWNVRTPERYIGAVRDGESTEAAGETLDDETRRVEGLQLALRMKDGVPADALDVADLDGLVVTDGDRVRLTRSGRLLANEVSLRLR
jgi:oxygen-independent coproporphyrinogen-3 oxidase